MRNEGGQRPDLGVVLGPLRLSNPLMTASGTAGYGTEGLWGLAPEALGAFVTKGISLHPRQGNRPPRIVETPAGMLNAIGLENVGIKAFASDHLPRLRAAGVRVIINFFGETEGEYQELAGQISTLSGVSGLEANVSCPNVQKGGRAFGRDPEALHRLVRRVRRETDLALLVKLTPDAAEILDTAQAAWEAGADALTVANAYVGLAVNVRTRRPRLGNGTGGLSGPAIRPLSLYRVWRVARVSPVPVVGVGGIGCARDALEYLIAGATAVQVGSASFGRLQLFGEILHGLRQFLTEGGLENMEGIIGSLEGMPEPAG